MRQRTLMISMAAALIYVAGLPATGQAQPGRPPVQLPDGEAKAMVEGVCVVCHRLDFITNSVGYTHEGWQELLDSMIILRGEQGEAMVSYLATHFPTKPDSGPVLIPGPVEITISEGLAPTLGSRPHDPLAADDGSIWWTGQFANRLGRLDPATGEMREFPLETANSGPHGLVEDDDGNIWFTAVSQGYVGKLDPDTGDVTEYPVPDGVRGPHTPIFDQDGTFWFTMQSGHVGRLVPATEEMTISATPTSGTYPYGIQVNSKGVPWYVDFRGNRVGSIDPETAEITEYELPNADSRPRRIALTPDDAVWYTDYTRGYLGRFDPETGEVQEWASPGGPGSRPYGIASVGNVIWYSETSMRPNTLVRFDTDTERFQSWAIPSGGGVIRNMMATADGDLVLACSAVNRIALVEVGT
ncbi:MAG: cytochrome C [Gammaproteobacteria bacterium]